MLNTIPDRTNCKPGLTADRDKDWWDDWDDDEAWEDDSVWERDDFDDGEEGKDEEQPDEDS